MISNEQIPTEEDEINLIALWRTAWSYKYIITLVTLLCGFVAGVLAFMATPVYRAEAGIIEVHENNMGGASSLVNQLGGLASLAGVNLGGVGGGQNHEAEAVLKSRYLVEEFIKRNNLLPELSRGAKKPRSLWFMVRRFQKGLLSIREDKLKSVTTITVDWTDPVVAARWANGIVALANELVRARALNDAKRNIAYLNEQIAQTNVVELRRVMYDLIESETKQLMLANGRTEYAFTVVDPAVAPEIPDSPKRALMVLAGLVLGSFLGLAIAVWHSKLVLRRRDVPPAG